VRLVCKAGRKGAGIMAFSSILAMLFVGLIAGWLAGRIVSGYGFGMIGNMVVGVVGAFIAAMILPQLGFTAGGGFLATVLHSTLGAIVLLVLLRIVKRV
jgi:uncharacterized membrane protein YeaQ/YmgE (transglycosylase-associated protein family)